MSTKLRTLQVVLATCSLAVSFGVSGQTETSREAGTTTAPATAPSRPRSDDPTSKKIPEAQSARRRLLTQLEERLAVRQQHVAEWAQVAEAAEAFLGGLSDDGSYALVHARITGASTASDAEGDVASLVASSTCVGQPASRRGGRRFVKSERSVRRASFHCQLCSRPTFRRRPMRSQDRMPL